MNLFTKKKFSTQRERERERERERDRERERWRGRERERERWRERLYSFIKLKTAFRSVFQELLTRYCRSWRVCVFWGNSVCIILALS